MKHVERSWRQDINPRLTNQVLNSLVNKEKNALRNLEYRPLDLNTVDRLRSWFMSTGQKETYNDGNFGRETRESLRMKMAGSIFEYIAYRCMEEEMENTDTGVLLSPSRTFEFFKHLYPFYFEASDVFGKKTIMGISVPDGLLVDTSNEDEYTLPKTYEYTSAREERIFQDKYNFFLRMKKNLPQVFENASLVFVVPKFSSRLPNVGRSNIVKFEELPFDHFQFSEFLNDSFPLLYS